MKTLRCTNLRVHTGWRNPIRLLDLFMWHPIRLLDLFMWHLIRLLGLIIWHPSKLVHHLQV